MSETRQKARRDHAMQRLLERLPGIRPLELNKLRKKLRDVRLPRGDHHARFGQGSVVLKDIGKRHVVATVLGPTMLRRPGEDMTYELEKNAYVEAAFYDELEKIASVEGLSKEALFETLRVGLKAAKQAFMGGKKLEALPGVFHAERQAAVKAGDSLIKTLEDGGSKIHRGRVKSPGSISANGQTQVPDDLLGLQAYAKTPEDVAALKDKLRRAGMSIDSSKVLTRPGYHGVNIKGNYQGTPTEIQLSPSRMSNIGQMMEHSLAYKPKTEAPYSNFIDRWFGKRVAPKMVSGGSWLPSSRPQLAAVGAT